MVYGVAIGCRVEGTAIFYQGLQKGVLFLESLGKTPNIRGVGGSRFDFFDELLDEFALWLQNIWSPAKQRTDANTNLSSIRVPIKPAKHE